MDWQRNLGSIDRIVRTVIGLLIIGLVLLKVLTGIWAVLAVLFAVVQFAEALFAY
ncbi:YgaP-like transmembrane domain [Desulfoscipio gibsoniae]|nr:YgaP-like transmembrane domain [Desulfoscipio gibsoniae]